MYFLESSTSTLLYCTVGQLEKLSVAFSKCDMVQHLLYLMGYEDTLDVSRRHNINTSKVFSKFDETFGVLLETLHVEISVNGGCLILYRKLISIFSFCSFYNFQKMVTFLSICCDCMQNDVLYISDLQGSLSSLSAFCQIVEEELNIKCDPAGLQTLPAASMTKYDSHIRTNTQTHKHTVLEYRVDQFCNR